ncbi:MAG: DUF4926 domain-containing protein [Bacteroidota bacterium]
MRNIVEVIFKEYDVVQATTDLSDMVLKDCKGTILMVYPDFPFSYEVEFVDKNHDTLEILTVKGYNLTYFS